MSRNFKLLQRAETERAALSFSGPVLRTTGASAAPEQAPGNIPVDGTIPVQEPCSSRVHLKAGIPRTEIEKLVQRLFFTQGGSDENSARVVVFTSIDAGDGTTSICSTTAGMLARHTAAFVAAIDARKGGHNSALRNCWNVRSTGESNGTEPEIAGSKVAANLSLLKFGWQIDGSDQFRTTELLRSRFRDLRARFGYVLIDAPPIVESSESIFLGHVADGVVLVLKANSTRKEAVRRVLADFEAAGVRVLGVVLNQRRFPIPDAIYSYL